jgi:hypothetical protein
MTAPQKHQLHKRPELLQERVHDTYRNAVTPKGPLVCETCGAVFEAGRWHWVDPPANANRGKCPACHRIADSYPAGVVACSGSFVTAHLVEMTALARNIEAREAREHPLERIMSITTGDGELTIETTGTHLARRIGKAIKRAMHGELAFEQAEGEHFVRARWHRDA